MLLYEESKTLEKAIGEDAAAVLVKAFERQNVVVNAETASKSDLRDTELRLQLEIEKVRSELKTDIEKVKYDLLKWQ